MIWNASSGSVVEEDTHMGAQPLAAYLGGALFFEHQDWLGTERMLTDGAGHTAGSYLSLPFGDGFTDQGTDLDPYHFAGMDHDYESGLDHAQFREYSSAGGRWLSPDPYSGSYDWSNPQSLNRYAYVLNNPLTFTDPSGRQCTDEVDPTTNTIYCTSSEFSDSGTSDDSWIVNGLVDIGEFIAGFFGGHPPIDTNPRPGVASNNVFTCASRCGTKTSLSNGLSKLGIGTSPVGGVVSSALAGNTFSSGTDLVTSFFTGSGGGQNVFYNMAQSVLAGPRQSIPGGSGAFGASATGLASDAIASAVHTGINLGGELTTLTGTVSTTALTGAEFASGVGFLKVGYDAVTYLGGLAGCAAGYAP